MKLKLLDGAYAICKLTNCQAIPDWAQGEFVSFSIEEESATVVCIEKPVPRDVQSEPGWRVFQVIGPFDFDVVGVLSSITAPLADNNIPLFAVSTYDTDYLLVKSEHLSDTISALSEKHELVNTC